MRKKTEHTILLLTTICFITFSCKSVTNVNRFYNQEYYKTKHGCYFLERDLQKTISSDTTIQIFVPAVRNKNKDEDSINSDTIFRNEIVNYSYYKFEERIGYSGDIKPTPILDPKHQNFTRLHRIYNGVTFEELNGSELIKSRVVEAQEHSMEVILENTSSNKDLTSVSIELIKGDYFTTRTILWVVCPLNISTIIKHSLCKKLDHQNFEVCYKSKYNEYLKDIVEDYQIENFGLDHEILFVKTLTKLGIDY